MSDLRVIEFLICKAAALDTNKSIYVVQPNHAIIGLQKALLLITDKTGNELSEELISKWNRGKADLLAVDECYLVWSNIDLTPKGQLYE